MKRALSNLKRAWLTRWAKHDAIIILIALFVVLGALVLDMTRSNSSNYRDVNQLDYARMTYLTGYSYWDNTPPGSAAIARPIIHNQAGGVGTYDDPITLAVGHSIIRSVQRLDFPAGTRFYFPKLRRYAIVEDVCGNGPTPQNGPCYIGHNGLPWLDIYVGGKTIGAAAATACMYAIGGVQQVIQNPSRGYPVVVGPLTEGRCSF